jgi:hypothetical protein
LLRVIAGHDYAGSTAFRAVFVNHLLDVVIGGLPLCGVNHREQGAHPFPRDPAGAASRVEHQFGVDALAGAEIRKQADERVARGFEVDPHQGLELVISVHDVIGVDDVVGC